MLMLAQILLWMSQIKISAEEFGIYHAGIGYIEGKKMKALTHYRKKYVRKL